MPRRNTAEPNTGGRQGTATNGRRVAPPRGTGNDNGAAAVRRGGERNPGNTPAGVGNGRGGGRAVAPGGRTRITGPGGGSTVIDQSRRGNGRNPRGNRPNVGRGGVIDRRPPRGNVVGTAVSRPPLRSRPIVVNNYGGGRGRGRSYGYTPYYGRYRGGRGIYGNYFYFPGYSSFNIGVGYGSYYRYNPYWNGYYGNAYGYAPYAYDGYGYGANYYTGSLRLKVQPRFGEVFVDGYYVGLVNDYDGIFQRLRLEEGPHHIEIVEPGYLPLEFDVMILPGETITYEGYLEPLP